MFKRISFPCLFLLALLLTGCGQHSIQVTPPSSKELYQVRTGDSVYEVAQKHYLSPEEIMRANNLQPPYHLSAGQRLKIPPLRRHTVVQGETLSRIAKDYRVSLVGLAELNRLNKPYMLTIGRKLQIPSSQYRAEAIAPATPKIVRAKKAARPAQPKLSEIKVIRVPRRIVQVAAAKTSTPKRIAPAPPKATKPKEAKAIKTEPTVSKKKSSKATGFGFIWPLRGKVISTFGSKSSGVRNDGINISAKVGSPVKAVAHGTVVYAGEKLSGFGRILIIRHEHGDQKGYMSAYAHNQALLVKRGDSVRQGEVIARSGKSGNVDSGQLHFEIRKGGKPLDPLKHLRS